MGPRRRLPEKTNADLLPWMYSLGFCLVVDFGSLVLINRGLSRSYGPGVSFWSIRNDHYVNLNAHFGSMILGLYVVGPFVDMAETVSFTPTLPREVVIKVVASN